MKRTPLVRSRRLNAYSVNKIAELNAEAPIRYQLIARCHGIPHETIKVVYHSGKKYTIRRVACVNGICEVCGQWQRLEPHEWPPRSRGTNVSLKFSKMVCRQCHREKQNNEPKWKTIGGIK